MAPLIVYGPAAAGAPGMSKLQARRMVIGVLALTAWRRHRKRW